jgi:hypothetical protein
MRWELLERSSEVYALERAIAFSDRPRILQIAIRPERLSARGPLASEETQCLVTSDLKTPWEGDVRGTTGGAAAPCTSERLLNDLFRVVVLAQYA